MNEDIASESPIAGGHRAGAMLAAARAKAKLDLAEISARTRIPQRHLAAIEAGDYGKLPSRTYAVGFSRSYARVLGLDERAVAEQVRLDLEAGDPQDPARPDRFEPGDPARVPSRRLAWLSALAVLLLVVGAFTFYRTYFSPGLGPAPLSDLRVTQETRKVRASWTYEGGRDAKWPGGVHQPCGWHLDQVLRRRGQPPVRGADGKGAKLHGARGRAGYQGVDRAAPMLSRLLSADGPCQSSARRRRS